jgi:integrase
LRFAEEIDLEDKLWRIPWEKMKTARDHLVPLSRQAIALLEEMRPFSGTGHYVFPGVRAGKATMRSQTLVAALRRMGFDKDETSAHGFRAMASTLLNEQGYPPDVIERQLAHVPGNQVRAAYNRAEYLVECSLLEKERTLLYLKADKARGFVYFFLQNHP